MSIDLPSLLERNPKLFGRVTAALLDTNLSQLDVKDYSTLPSPKQDIYKIISDTYGYEIKDAKAKFAAESLARYIRKINGLGLKQRLITKDLKLPPFFNRPEAPSSYYSQVWDTKNNAELVQVLNVQNSTSATVLAADEAAYANAVDIPLSRASLSQTILTTERYKEFTKLLSQDELHDLFSSGSFDVRLPDGVVDVDHPEFDRDVAFSSVAPAPTELSGRTDIDADVGVYYIIDFFAQKEEAASGCSHGQLVYEVARTSLLKYGAGSLIDNNRIQTKEFNFFFASEEDKKVIEDYIERGGFSDNSKLAKRAELDNLKKIVPDRTKKVTSMLYIQALYWSLLSRPDTAVISSSAYAKFDFYQPLPIKYDGRSSVPLLNAVLNETGSDINNPKYEPLRYFFNTSGKLPTVLIGASRGSSFDGMSDAKKEGGVTSIGPGAWQVVTHCGNQQQLVEIWGASYATPALGSMILTAKAYWKKQGKDYSAHEVRRRLVLASAPQESLVGLFASAGIPQLDKLLLLDQPVAVDNDSKIHEVTLEASTVTVDANTFSLAKSPNGISGLVVNTETPDSATCNAFLYFEDLRRWECRRVKDVSLNFVLAGEPNSLNWSNFTQRYKEILIP